MAANSCVSKELSILAKRKSKQFMVHVYQYFNQGEDVEVYNTKAKEINSTQKEQIHFYTNDASLVELLFHSIL